MQRLSSLLLLFFYAVFLVACFGQVDPKLAFDRGDYDISYKNWIVIAQQGDPEAQNYIGIHHYLGLGVERDPVIAAEWYEKSAKQNYPPAQRNYGNLFFQGLGVDRDFYAAYIWYFAASQQGNESAKNQLAILVADNKLSPNQQMHASLEANQYITDPKLRFYSHDNYTGTD